MDVLKFLKFLCLVVGLQTLINQLVSYPLQVGRSVNIEGLMPRNLDAR